MDPIDCAVSLKGTPVMNGFYYYYYYFLSGENPLSFSKTSPQKVA